MNSALSRNTQAILLLTAPLIVGRTERSSDVLTPGEYKRLARFLHEQKLQPADLLGDAASDVLDECEALLDRARLQRLLDRGFLLSQAVEFWQARAIWVVSRADQDYPQRLKDRLKDDAPAVLYGCGDASILETGGLAVVGSRHVDDALIDYAEAAGRLTARAGRTLISGGARGIDQAAMFGALAAGGRAIGILADRLERSAMMRDARDYLLEQQLVLISPYDPLAGFNVGNAMQRNKLIYALADAALVVSSDYKKGGTWAGAIEQLEKYRFVPIFVRSDGTEQDGLKALQRNGALPWPNPSTPEELEIALACEPHSAPPIESNATSAIQQSLFAES
jgi:predicted Rossmann fold nucleotide-binding protein DprA/Smf involved in DNA uptake